MVLCHVSPVCGPSEGSAPTGTCSSGEMVRGLELLQLSWGWEGGTRLQTSPAGAEGRPFPEQVLGTCLDPASSPRSVTLSSFSAGWRDRRDGSPNPQVARAPSLYGPVLLPLTRSKWPGEDMVAKGPSQFRVHTHMSRLPGLPGAPRPGAGSSRALPLSG